MSVKASVSMTNQQDAFARRLVEEGRYSSVSAVVQRGLDMLQHQTELEQAELEALRAFFKERMEGPVISNEEGRRQTQELIARKRQEYGL